MSSVKLQDDEEIIHEIMEMMGNIPIFDKVACTETRVIATHMSIVYLEGKEALFSEGDSSDYMYFVVSGKLDILKQSGSGKVVRVATLARGRIIGEMALIDTLPRSATVVAQASCTLLAISRASFYHILEQRPRAGILFLKGIAKLLSLHLRRASGQLADASC